MGKEVIDSKRKAVAPTVKSYASARMAGGNIVIQPHASHGVHCQIFAPRRSLVLSLPDSSLTFMSPFRTHGIILSRSLPGQFVRRYLFAFWLTQAL